MFLGALMDRSRTRRHCLINTESAILSVLFPRLLVYSARLAWKHLLPAFSAESDFCFIPRTIEGSYIDEKCFASIFFCVRLLLQRSTKKAQLMTVKNTQLKNVADDKHWLELHKVNEAVPESKR